MQSFSLIIHFQNNETKKNVNNACEAYQFRHQNCNIIRRKITKVIQHYFSHHTHLRKKKTNKQILNFCQKNNFGNLFKLTNNIFFHSISHYYPQHFTNPNLSLNHQEHQHSFFPLKKPDRWRREKKNKTSSI